MEALFFHDSQQKKYRSLFGAVPTGARITLRLDVFCPEVQRVELRLWQEAGAHNGETLIPMVKNGAEPYYTAQLQLPHRGCLIWYYFIIKSSTSVQYYGNNSENLGGQGQVYDHEPPSFQITVYAKDSTTPDWFKNGVVYQIFPDRFYHSKFSQGVTAGKTQAVFHKQWSEVPAYLKDEKGCVLKYDFFGGNLMGIREKLPYLQDLGVTILYLNPIFESASNHRYDTGDYMKIDGYLGTDAEFSLLCQEAAEQGIRIVLDGVFSHTGDDSIYFNKYGNYAQLGAYQSPQSPYYPWYKFHDYPDKYESWWGVGTLPEVVETTPSYMEYIFRGEDSVLKHWLKAGISGWRLDVADELPAEFLQGFWQELKKSKSDGVLIGEVWEDASNKISYGQQRAYLCGGKLDSVMNYVMRAIMLDFVLGKDNASHINRRINSQRENYPQENFYAMLNLLGTHDVERVLTLLRAADKNTAEERLQLLWTWQMTMPGTPCVYYGDEAGVEGGKDPDNRRTYPWGQENQELLTKCRNLIHLRRKYAALRTGRFIPLCGDEQVLVYGRAIEGGQDVFHQSAEDGFFIVLLNASSEKKTLTIYTDGLAYGVLENILQDGQCFATEGGTFSVTMEPLEAMVLTPRQEKFTQRAGILLHPTSLPRLDKNGDITDSALKFIDFLVEAGQSVWQILPLAPTGTSASPYFSPSAFAGNIKLFSQENDFASVVGTPEYKKFCQQHSYWLADFALYEALKKYFKQQAWWQWPDDIKQCQGSALKKYTQLLQEDILTCQIQQYEFFRKWHKIKTYAKSRGLQLLGDMPIFVAHDSADCWAHQEFFQLGEDGMPTSVAGVPPDYFSAKGQVWGNPLYAWQTMEQDKYNWWVQRFRTLAQLVDEVRVDHFRGFVACWAVPAQAQDAREGVWVAGPGRKLFAVLNKALPHVKLVAEDLGVITPDVYALKNEFALPGMRIMEFMLKDRAGGGVAFDTEPNCLAYTGTHDNNTLLGWYLQELTSEEQARVRHMLQLEDDCTVQDLTYAALDYLYSRRASTVIVPMQDVLGLPATCRMNIPGTVTGNWQWSMTEQQLKSLSRERLAALARKYGRCKK